MDTIEDILKQWEEFVNGDEPDITMPYDGLDTFDAFDAFDDTFDSTFNKTYNYTLNNTYAYKPTYKWNPLNVTSNKSQFAICYTHCAKPFIRIKLKHDTTEIVHEVLKLLHHSIISIRINNKCVYNVPLNFIVLMSEMLSYNITVINVQKFKSIYSSEEISDMQVTKYNNYYTINEKYYFDKDHDIYLDIPLLLDYFTYIKPTKTLYDIHTSVCFSIYSNNRHSINNLCCEYSILYEELYVPISQSYQLYNNNKLLYTFVNAKPFMLITDCNNIHKINLNCDDISQLMFIFIKIKPTNTNYSVHTLPVIEKMSIEYCTSFIEINTDNILCLTYDDFILCGISLDWDYNMRNWINMKKETIIENKKNMFKNKANTNITEDKLNSLSIYNNNMIKYFTVNMMLSSYDISIDMTYYLIYKNTNYYPYRSVVRHIY